MCQRVSVIRILLSAPHAKDPMLIVVNPYSKNQEKIAEYAPADIDSIVVWPRSNSAVRLTFVFLKKYGWAMKIDQSQKYDVYQFASKGYGLLGSTCRWFYGDSKLLVGDGGKDGKFGEIKAPSETSPEKFTKQIAKLCPDDEPLQQRLFKQYGNEYTDNQVVVTFENGDTIEGYLRKDIRTVAKNMFSSLGGSTTIPKFINISHEPKGEATRYSSNEASRIHFRAVSATFPSGAIEVAEDIMFTKVFNKSFTSHRGFVWLWEERPSGGIYRWSNWVTTGGKNPQRRLVPAVGVRLSGIPGVFLISESNNVFLSLLFLYLKKETPELYSFMKEYYEDSQDCKGHKNELQMDPSTILDLYEKYLKTHSAPTLGNK